MGQPPPTPLHTSQEKTPSCPHDAVPRIQSLPDPSDEADAPLHHRRSHHLLRRQLCQERHDPGARVQGQPEEPARRLQGCCPPLSEAVTRLRTFEAEQGRTRDRRETVLSSLQDEAEALPQGELPPSQQAEPSDV